MLKLIRLEHTPPAFYSTQILQEHALPLLVVEYGKTQEVETHFTSPFPRWRLQAPWVLKFPNKLHSSLLFFHALFSVAQKIRQEGRPSLIIAHGINEQVMAYILSRLFKMPYVVHVHEIFEMSDVTLFNRLLLLFEGLALRRALFLVFPETGRSALYKSRYGLSNPIHIVFNCPRLRLNKKSSLDIRALHSIPNHHTILLYMGGISELNALSEAVCALAFLKNVSFLITGWGDESYLTHLKKLAHERAVADQLIIVPNVEDKWSYIETATLGYCVYRPQTLRTKYLATASNKFSEFISVGVPVITTSNPDFAEVVQKYGIGRCLKNISEIEIVETIKSLLSTPEQYQKMRQNCLEAHRSFYNYEYQFSKVLKIVLEQSVGHIGKSELDSAAV